MWKRAEEDNVCVSARHARCLLPVVLMPPTVQELQGQSWVLTMSVPSYPLLLHYASTPPLPVDCGNSSLVALIQSLTSTKHMQT